MYWQIVLLMRRQLVPVVLLMLILIIPYVTVADDCDLWGMAAQSEDGLFATAFYRSVNIFREESQDRGNDDGWGLIGWDEVGFLYDIIHSDYNVWDAPPQGIEYRYNSWNNGFRLVMAHSRRAETGHLLEDIDDPHPFIYNLWGNTFGLAHNGSLYGPNDGHVVLF